MKRFSVKRGWHHTGQAEDFKGNRYPSVKEWSQAQSTTDSLENTVR